MAQDRFAQVDDRVGVAIDRPQNRALQFVLLLISTPDVQPAQRVSGTSDGATIAA
jgi:hypothetical protein